MTPSGPVAYGYATVAGIGAALGSAGKPPGAGAEIPVPNGSAVADLGTTSPFYVTVAWGDSDADGTPAVVVSYSVSNQLFMQQE